MLSSEVLRFAQDFPRGRHSMLFFSRPQEKLEVLAAFTKAGLETGENVCYLSFANAPDQLLAKLERIGINTASALKEGRLTVVTDYKLPSGPMFGRAGTLNVDNFHRAFQPLVSKAKSAGFRLASTAPEHLLKRGTPKELVRLEQEMRKVASDDISVLCAYDSVKFRGDNWYDVFSDVTHSHSQGLFLSEKGVSILDLPGGEEP